MTAYMLRIRLVGVMRSQRDSTRAENPCTRLVYTVIYMYFALLI